MNLELIATEVNTEKNIFSPFVKKFNFIIINMFTEIVLDLKNYPLFKFF